MNTKDCLYYSTYETIASKTLTIHIRSAPSKKNNLGASDLTFSFLTSCGVHLSSLSVRKRYDFHFPARIPNPDEKLKLSVSQVPQSQKA